MNKETSIQNEIMAELSKHHCMVLRQQSGVYYTSNGQRIRIGFPGLSDLLVVRPDGIVAFLEVKENEKSYRRPEQIKFIDKCHERGLRAGFVWTVKQALEVVYATDTNCITSSNANHCYDISATSKENN